MSRSIGYHSAHAGPYQDGDLVDEDPLSISHGSSHTSLDGSSGSVSSEKLRESSRPRADGSERPLESSADSPGAFRDGRSLLLASLEDGSNRMVRIDTSETIFSEPLSDACSTRSGASRENRVGTPGSSRRSLQSSRTDEAVSRGPWYRSSIFWAKFWLVMTGVWWGICMQLIVYEGAGHPLSLLPNITWYIGMMLCDLGSLCRTRSPHYARVSHAHMIPIGLCDWLGTVGTTVGLVRCGSAIFGIIYSSVTVWAALFSCCILNKSQSPLRVAGILAVVVGLILPTIEQESASDDGQAIVVGIALTALGTLFYAFEYVLCERLFTQYKQPVDSKQLCLYTGMWGMLFTLVWMCVYTFPNWEQIVMQEVRDAGGRPWVILALYVSHLLSNAVHNLAWFATCELEGGVSTGLLMGVKAVILFFASSLCFCNPHRPEQCMSIAKGLATGVVLLGTTLYYWPSSFVAQRARAWARAARQPRWMPRGSVFVGRRGGGGALIRDPLSGKMRSARGGHRRIARPTQKALTTLFDMRGEAYGRLHGQGSMDASGRGGA